MKPTVILCIVMISLCLLLAACRKKPDASQTESAPDAASSAGKYPVNEKGEAVINDVAPAVSADDNACVFYEIFVGAFSDSDGDGIGDLRGIISRMDYLNDGKPDSGLSLGVEGLWLTPVFQSPSYHKYDVTDYYRIDSQFGSLDDLKELISLCHERGVKIILDLPLNHTATDNEWFLAFRAARAKEDPSDPYYDFYTCYPAGGKLPDERRFTALAGTDVVYECNFSEGMPELNFDSEAVRLALLDVAKYYLALGVDGFRFDAAKYPYLGENAANISFWTWYMAELRAVKPDVYAVAEVWDTDNVTDAYYAAVDCFNFTSAQAEGLITSAVKTGDISSYMTYLEEYLNTVQAKRRGALLHAFIANHDTDRAAGYLSLTNGQMQMAANLYLLGPGSPFIYYGEEIGMKGSRGSAHTDANRRLAMLWGDNDTVKDPVGSDYDASAQVNGTLASQLGTDSSLYMHYKRLLMIRRAFPAIARGSFVPLSLSYGCGGFIAGYEGESVCVLHNVLNTELKLKLSDLSAEIRFTQIGAVIGADSTSYARIEGEELILSPQTSAVLQPGK